MEEQPSNMWWVSCGLNEHHFGSVIIEADSARQAKELARKVLGVTPDVGFVMIRHGRNVARMYRELGVNLGVAMPKPESEAFLNRVDSFGARISRYKVNVHTVRHVTSWWTHRLVLDIDKYKFYDSLFDILLGDIIFNEAPDPEEYDLSQHGESAKPLEKALRLSGIDESADVAFNYGDSSCLISNGIYSFSQSVKTQEEIDRLVKESVAAGGSAVNMIGNSVTMHHDSSGSGISGSGHKC